MYIVYVIRYSAKTSIALSFYDILQNSTNKGVAFVLVTTDINGFVYEVS